MSGNQISSAGSSCRCFYLCVTPKQLPAMQGCKGQVKANIDPFHPLGYCGGEDGADVDVSLVVVTGWTTAFTWGRIQGLLQKYLTFLCTAAGFLASKAKSINSYGAGLFMG